ncbi:helix-turn-helix protein [Ilumatobacter fluminis]|uniref:Helix-turn-helix protein n=1 Tax=Ilumatobacter fluminis TaxID=467091 RepID=A0A4R7HUU8_9ACTN|nr:helix-turn-helix protein [Ilumatobacter fluminis]
MTIRTVRERAGLSMRELARRAGTSHATLSAYEHGAKSPTAATLQRIVRAAGVQPVIAFTKRAAPASRRGDELEAVLRLAGQFPARHRRRLDLPVFGRAS